ncbi:MAG: CocE/NonD family hydrolase [Nitrososphaerota archaeon]|nr:CocE/NonD family hydrolase [Nitrososphaerota archaeon]
MLQYNQSGEITVQMKSERDIYVQMRDGVKVAVDIFRPDDAKGRFPALLAMSPYGKGVQSLKMPTQPPGTPLYLPPIEAGNPEYLVANGYAHIIADTRGTGKSEGEYLGWISKEEARDGYDLIEWIAKQPWCDGNVGMVGISYFGTVQLMIAAEQPPHLKAIMPWNAVADFYRETTHHGGIMQTFLLYLYHTRLARRNYASVAEREFGSAKFRQKIEALKDDSDYAMYPELYNMIDNPTISPNLLDVLIYENDGPFYWERSATTKYEKIKVPFYARSGWWAFAHMHLYGAFWNFNSINAPKKLQIDKPMVEDRPLNDEFNKEVIRWYDYWLKGKDTGIMKEAPISIFVRGKNEWRNESEWPLSRTKWIKAHLRTRGILQMEPPIIPGRNLTYESDDSIGLFDVFAQQPLSETPVVQSLEYKTLPLSNDLELTGPMAFYFHASIDKSDTNWIISFRDYLDENCEVELSKGFLKASHRALDEKKSKPWEPYHPHLKAEPVAPDQIIEYAISMAPISNVFKAGHRLKLVISNMDHAFSRDWRIAPPTIGLSHYPWHVGIRKTVVHRIYHESEIPSYLLLPSVPRSSL